MARPRRRHDRVAELPAATFGPAFAAFYRANNDAFPGEAGARNFAFAAPHDSSHLLAGADTFPARRSTFTAGMHRDEAVSGHVCRSFSVGIWAFRSKRRRAPPRARIALTA